LIVTNVPSYVQPSIAAGEIARGQLGQRGAVARHRRRMQPNARTSNVTARGIDASASVAALP
jgi:hypothetical protein